MNMTEIPHVHYPFLLKGRYVRDTNGNIDWANEGKPMDISILYHYWTKSRKEYMAKRLRGRCDVDNKESVKNLVHQARLGVGITNGTILDDTVWEAVKKYNPKYAVFDKSFAAPVDGLAIKTGEKESVAICCLVRDDEAYIDEWVDYHHAMGFDHIYIYDPSVHFELQQWEEEKGDQVTVYHYASNCSQDDAYLDCARGFGLHKNHTWMAFFNVNEFLVL
jgi:Glycosyl transferase family 2